MYRPGIDVTQAELVPHLNWRRQERAEVVGNWKAKIYDMLHVMVSVKSRRVPGAMTDEERFSVDDDQRTGNGAFFLHFAWETQMFFVRMRTVGFRIAMKMVIEIPMKVLN
ncbi:hypothetical protein LOK49_LG13G00902 [Camellia lanceoleosa]|uniref:Uncharacterized protein n=1 Tax=Camellia lanceoleosa TaxID=1840588 RepID=A0ACC0FM89_9ERIC|nr:hypothetical protein LOK49_LG13G00902 [Camellia lanceoleosa]